MSADDEPLNEADQLVAEQVGEWSSSSNDALTVAIVQGKTEIETFHPEFTYPIYGEEEVIFGYQELEINLSFAAHNLRPHVEFKYKHKFPSQGEIHAADVLESLKDFLPAIAFSEKSRDAALADKTAHAFIPPGERIDTFTTNNGTYEVWCSSLVEPRAKEILQNMQILVPFYIEGGTILELEYPWVVERWKLFLLYQVTEGAPKDVSPYVFAGYATSFQVFSLAERGATLEANVKSRSEADMDQIISSWTDSTASKASPLSLPSRERISQFILLPSHQGSGAGSQLYAAVYAHLTAPSHVTELTVEDPNEAFDDMRDVADLLHLRATNTTFTALSLPDSLPPGSLSPSSPVPSSIIPPSTRAQLAKQTKIQPRQLARLIEMQLLSSIPRLHRSASRITRRERASNPLDRAYYFWRLAVKERLYQHNRDALAQLERQERVEKLDDAVEGVQADYERLLEVAERRAKVYTVKKRSVGDAGEGDEDGQHAPRKKKRRVVSEDEDGEE